MSPRRVGWISGAVAGVLVVLASAAGRLAAAPGKGTAATEGVTVHIASQLTIANTVVFGGLIGLAAGLAAYRVAAATRGRDRAERLLALATAGLPARRAEWGAAMRAELAAIDDPDARRRFARSASAAAFGQGLGKGIAFALATGVLVAAVTLTASRVQLHDERTGVVGVTVFVPAILLLAVALVTANAARSFRIGLETGALALAASFGAVFSVVAIEGLVWMERHGVFVLDGDPPRHDVGDVDVIFNLFSSGMWRGHLIFWLPWTVIGAALGASIAARRGSADADASSPRDEPPLKPVGE